MVSVPSFLIQIARTCEGQSSVAASAIIEYNPLHLPSGLVIAYQRSVSLLDSTLMWYLPHSPCQNWFALVKPDKPSCFVLRKRRSCGTPSTDVLRLPKTVYQIGNLKTLECFFEIWLHPWFWEVYVVYSILWKCFSSVCKSTRAYFRLSVFYVRSMNVTAYSWCYLYPWDRKWVL